MCNCNMLLKSFPHPKKFYVALKTFQNSNSTIGGKCIVQFLVNIMCIQIQLTSFYGRVLIVVVDFHQPNMRPNFP